ncbi:hypothetical protein [Streptomyces sp. NPDC088360]|uniref:hypothetical protein n=1 Tax=Streptomyces sp. NPDC088360 TaxID=3154515 RepID=UPI00344E14E7
MPTPTLGRTVLFRASADDAAQINKRRKDAHDSGLFHQETGAVAHVGNEVAEGQQFPGVIVRLWQAGSVNLQVHLDGNDVLWATSRSEGNAPGQWAWPEVR